MKKVGVALSVVFILAALSVFVGAQCVDECTQTSDCDIDQQCVDSCCAGIPCETSIDCPFACLPPAPESFAPLACNNCIDGFCVDPCNCDYGETCIAPGPCGSNSPRCVAGDCVSCVTDCDCADPDKPFSPACPGSACVSPFSNCASGLCFRQQAGNPRNDCVSNNCNTGGTFSCSDSCSFNSQCNDGDICTDDVCQDDGTCANPNNNAPCSIDINPCTDDVCISGTCTAVNNIVQCGSCDQCDGSGTCETDCDLQNDADGDTYPSCIE